MSRRRAFTMIELLVVIGVIVLLIAILMPALSRAREAANAVKCSSNVRTLTGAFLLFAQDHEGHLPGTKQNWYMPNGVGTAVNDKYDDWLFGQYSHWEEYGANTLKDRVILGPQSGTLWKYVNNYSVYLCPSLLVEPLGGGSGSNGRFDYAAFATWNGASLRNIKPISQMHYPAINQWPKIDLTGQSAAADPMSPKYATTYLFSSLVDNLPTPIICQEDPQFRLNKGDMTSTATYHWSDMDGQHGYWERMAHCHGGGSYYGAVDGSVQYVNEPDVDPADPNQADMQNFYWCGARLWWQKGPASSVPRPLDDWQTGWNQWATE